MTDAPSDSDDELSFEHVGTLAVGEQLLLCDVDYAPARFAGMRNAAVALDVVVDVEPGTWQVLLARAPDQRITVVLLTHDAELDVGDPLEHAEVIAHLRVDSGRITALDPDLRDDETIQTALVEAPREQVPCLLRPLDAASDDPPRGALIDIDTGGVFELYATLGRPRTALFLLLD
jgi:hypothetical protein